MIMMDILDLLIEIEVIRLTDGQDLVMGITVLELQTPVSLMVLFLGLMLEMI